MNRLAKAVALSSVAGVAQRAAQILSTLAFIPILTRALGADGFGIWGAATSLVVIAWTFDLGVGNALITLIPRSIAGRTASDAADIVAGAVAFTIGLSLIILATGAGLSAVVTAQVPPSFIVAGVALAINIPLGLAGRLWLALQKGHLGSAWEFAQTCITAASLGVGVWAGWSISALVACVYGAMVIANSASLIHLFWRHPELRPRRVPPVATWRELLIQGGSMLGISAATAAGWGLDNALTLFLLGPVAAAWMNIALRLCTTAFGLISAIAQSFWPAFAEAAHSDRIWVRQALVRSSVLLTGLSLIGSLALVTIGGPLLRLWLGHDLGVDGRMLWAVGAWVTAAAAIQAPLLLLLAVSQARMALIALCATSVVGLVLKILAASYLGPGGILLVLPMLNLLVVLPVCAWSACTWLDTSEPDQELIAPLRPRQQA